MEQSQRSKISIRDLDREPLYESLLHFIIKLLSTVLDDKCVISGTEDEVTSQINKCFLMNCLNNKWEPSNRWVLSHQDSHGNQHGIPDISVYQSNGDTPWENPFTVIEAKWLHTAPKNRNAYYNKSYVKGKTGGIERFKLCRHGVIRSGKILSKCFMFGYMKANSPHGFGYWHKKTNCCIAELAEKNVSQNFWKKSDQLNNLSAVENRNDLVKCESQHSRIDKNSSNVRPVALTHFWIMLPTA